MSKKSKLGLRFANAVIDPKTINEESRSVEVTFATETPVEQYIMGEYGFEVLRCATKNVDLKRFKAGVVPLLDTHNRYSIKGQMGAASNPVIADGVCRCTITFSKREEVEAIWQDVKDGIIKGISAGYRVVQYIVDRTIGETPYFYANKWEPREISLAPVPADGNSNIRSSANDEDLNECEIIDKNRTVMTKEEIEAKRLADEKLAAERLEAKTRAAGGAQNPEIIVSEDVQRTANAEFEKTNKKPTPTPKVEEPVNVTAEAQRAADAAIVNERTRTSTINMAVRSAGLPAEFGVELVDAGHTADKARALIIDKIAEEQAAGTRGSQNANITLGDEAIDKARTGMEEALNHRANGGDLKDEAKPYRGMNLVRMSEEILRVGNIDITGMSPRKLAERALSTTDFPIILGNTVNRTLRAAYELAPRTFLPITRRGNAKDFRPMTKAAISGVVDNLDLIPEGGEYKRSKMSEEGESYQVAKYGKIIPITWETLVNDDLDAFSRIPTALANKAAQKQSDLVWAIITGNPDMADGNALFSVAHKNLGTAGALSETTLNEMRKLMRNQVSIEGDFINVTPSYLVVGPDLETAAQKIINAVIMATKTADTNVFKNWVNIIVEPRLTGNQWYMVGNPAAIDTIEYSFLDGEAELFTEQKQGFDIDGMEIKARMVFGAKALDWRGMYKNAGA